MLRLYTDESPGLKVDPFVVLVLSVGFIISVVALHSTTPHVSKQECNVSLTPDAQFWPRSPKSSPRRHIPFYQSRACDTGLVLYCALAPFLVSPIRSASSCFLFVLGWKKTKSRFYTRFRRPRLSCLFSLSKNTRFSSWILQCSLSLVQDIIAVLRISRVCVAQRTATASSGSIGARIASL